MHSNLNIRFAAVKFSIIKSHRKKGKQFSEERNRDEDEKRGDGKKRNSGRKSCEKEKEGGRGIKLAQEELFAVVVFSFSRGGDTRIKRYGLIAIYVCPGGKQTNETNSKANGEDTVLLLQRINFATFILCAPFVIILQRKCYRRTLHDCVRAEIKSAIFVTELEVRLG